MACCLTAPSHYLNQCWLIVNTDQWRLSKVNFTRDTPAIIHENQLQFAEIKFLSNLPGANELNVFEMVAISPPYVECPCVMIPGLLLLSATASHHIVAPQCHSFPPCCGSSVPQLPTIHCHTLATQKHQYAISYGIIMAYLANAHIAYVKRCIWILCVWCLYQVNWTWYAWCCCQTLTWCKDGDDKVSQIWKYCFMHFNFVDKNYQNIL